MDVSQTQILIVGPCEECDGGGCEACDGKGHNIHAADAVELFEQLLADHQTRQELTKLFVGAGHHGSD